MIRLVRTYSTVPFEPHLLRCDSLQNVIASRKLNKTFDRLGSLYLADKIQVLKDGKDATECLNSTRSLPTTKFPKDDIFQKVANDRNIGQWRKLAVQWFRIGLHVLKYYRDGMQNTYRVFQSTRPIYKKYECKTHSPLVTQLFRALEYKEIEYHTLQKWRPSDTVLPITRKEFLEFSRRNEIWKIPTFFVIALIFEELTAVICYIYPKVAPYNCLTPSGFKKIAAQYVKDRRPSTDSYQTPYTISQKELYSALNTKLTKSYIPHWKLTTFKWFGNHQQASETLMHVYQHLYVDDMFLLLYLLQHKTLKLTYQELVNCILERKLYNADEDINCMVNDKIGRRTLLWRLIVYWSHKYDNCQLLNKDGHLFNEKWGVNNITLLQQPGTVDHRLISETHVNTIENGFTCT